MKQYKFIFALLMAIVMMAISPTRMWAQSSVQTEPAQNEIWYTSSDGNIITPYIDSSWGVEIDKNEYKNGRGVITFKQNLTEIGEWAFSWDKGSSYNLETIVFPEGVTKIAYGALSYHSTGYNSNKLKSITIPSTVTELGMTLFAHTDIDDLYLKMPSPANITIGNEIFYDSNVGTVHVPENCAPLYRESNNWKDCNIIEMVEGPADNEIWYTTSDNKPITFEDGTYFGIWLDYFTNIYNDELDCYVLSFYEDEENQYPMKVTDLYEAFQGKTTLTSVTLPSSCKTIENGAFADCTSLSTINLPEGLKTILIGAFSGNACTSITIPSSVTSICAGAFYSSTLTDVYVKHLTPMKGCDAYAFTDCSKLTLHVPDGKIDAYAETSEIWASFGTITSPHSHNLIPFDVTITKTGASESTQSKESAKLITINKSAAGNPQVAVQSGSEEATPTVFEHNTRYDFALTPVTTITIGDDDIEGNIVAGAKRRTAAALQEPTLTGPALVVGTTTAYTTYPLDAEHTDITLAMSADGKYIVNDSEIEGTVTSIYFYDPHQLDKINKKDATCTTVGYSSDCWSCSVCGNYFSDEAGEKEIAASTVVIPATGKHEFGKDDPGQTFCTVCRHTFFRYTASNRVTPKTSSNLKNASGQCIYVDSQNTWDSTTKEGVMEFNEPLTEIGNYAFQNCSFTGNLIIPNSVTSIGGSAFRDCTGFTGNLTIGSSVASIGEEAFALCNFSGTLDIPASVTSIGNYALNFGETSSITDITVHWATPSTVSLGNLILRSKECTLHVPGASYSAYKSHSYWKGFSSIVCIDHSNTSVQEQPSCTHGNLTYSLCSVCGSKTNFVDTGTSLGGHIMDDTNSICTREGCGHGFFHYNTASGVIAPKTPANLKDADGNTLEIISNTVTDGVGEIEFNKPLVTIGDAFDNCQFTGDLVVPSTVTTIGDYAFAMTGLTGTITLPASLESVGASVFTYCEGLQTIAFRSIPQCNSGYKGYGISTSVTVDLTDQSYIYAGDSKLGTVSAFSYPRTVTGGNIVTFVLPVSVPVSNINGKVWKFKTYEGDKFKFEEITSGSTEANVPYLVQLDESATELLDGNITGNLTINATATPELTGEDGVAKHIGTYTKQTVASDETTSYYGFSQATHKFVKANSGTLNPFRTMFRVSTPVLEARSCIDLQLGADDDETTQIIRVDSDLLTGTGSPMYNLQGQRITKPVKGQVYIQNGKKVIY